MATLYENYVGARETWSSLDNVNDRSCETFIAGSTHDAGAIHLWLYHDNNPGDLTVSLTATDGAGKPTGGALASGTILEANIPEGQGNAAWVEVVFPSPYSVSNTVKYAIVLSAPSSEAQKVVFAGRSTASGGYSNGQIGLSTNGGSSWIVADSPDLLFKVYDESNAPGKAQNPTPADDEEDIKLTGISQLKKFQWEAPT